MTRAVLRNSIFVFQSRLAKGSPTILEVYKQYQTSSSQKKKVHLQGHGAAQKSESSGSSSGMLFVVTLCGDVSTVSVDLFPAAVGRSKEHTGCFTTLGHNCRR